MEKEMLQIKTLLLEEEAAYTLPEEYPVQGEVVHLTTRKREQDNPCDYGALYGWNKIKKEVHDTYLCVNAGEVLPQVSQEQLQALQEGSIRMILPRVYSIGALQEGYRDQYYDYDFQIMLSLLKKEYPAYYRHAKEKVLDARELFLLGGIFRKKEFDRIWSWVYTVLKRCAKFIPERCSVHQNRYLEHLAPYLFTIYITYWEKKTPYEVSLPEKLQKQEMPGEESEEAGLEPQGDWTREELLTYLDQLLSFGKVEKAVVFSRQIPDEREEVRDIRAVFLQYEKERRYHKETQLDKYRDMGKLLALPEKPVSESIIKGKPRLLIFVWNSIGNDTNIQAFEDFGFECHTIQVPYDRNKFDEDCLIQVNRHLDFNQFDLVYSLNCSDMVAEACYIHDIPYLAWCYDSPSFTGKKGYYAYPTTHVYAFDSDDANHYHMAGIDQAYYMPLATNWQYFEGIQCSDQDREKYSAEISFIGSLYDTGLPEGMGYLTDYQKAYLNALMDNQLDVYGHSFFPEILSQGFMEWLDQPDFNRLLNAEWEKEKAKDSTASAGRLQLVLNKQTTNKERLLLLNLLAKHHQVKLYSYKNSEALKGLTFCGRADYYTEMPKIFRLSKINLNATLRSIAHGIPLRCLDVMACHGLLLTNYQKDFDDHFKDGENVLFYTDAEEALEKADFYLAHDSLREKIAENGFETVKKYYDYPTKIREMLELAGLEHLIPAQSRQR
jgi:spore maturation protein CgeB